MHGIAATATTRMAPNQPVSQYRLVNTIQMTAAALTPISIELDKGPKGIKRGIEGVRKMKMESKIVPGNTILRASLCKVRLLRESNMKAEK